MTADKPGAKKETRLWLLFLLLGLAAAGWAIYWWLCAYYVPASQDSAAVRGQFGDMFGGINALFSAFAFAGLIYTVLLQRQELALQRQELEQTREELKRSADAQEASRKVLEKQTELLTVSAQMSAWSKMLEVWTHADFREGRGRMFDRLRSGNENWTEHETEDAKEVCRRMDEFAYLAPFLGQEKVLDVWDDPIAKAWQVLEQVVVRERSRSGWNKKWNAFENLGKAALQRLSRENRFTHP